METMTASSPSSRFFNREMEKTPSLEKEEVQQQQQQGSRVEMDLPDELSPDKGRVVVDFAYIDAIYAETVAEIPERTPQEGDKAISDLPELAVDEDGTVMQLVGHVYVLALLKSPPLTRPITILSIDDIRRKTGITDEEVLEEVVAARSAMKQLRDMNNDIIRQYLDKGYAYIALPLDASRYPHSPEARKLLPPLP